MSRVWKRFLLKVGKGVAAISYVLGSMVLGGFISPWLGYDPEAGILVAALIMVVLPMIAFLLRDTYKDAKQEVEWENREMMRRIKGGY